MADDSRFSFNYPAHQLGGIGAVKEALISEHTNVKLIVVRAGCTDDKVLELLHLASDLNVPIREESDNDLRRMSRVIGTDILALVGREPSASLHEVLHSNGAVWLMSQVTYPSNVGVAIRSAEVAGAAAVIVDGDFNRPERRRALRVSMRADRFMPVLWADSASVIAEAKKAGRVVIGLEDSGTIAPWSIDLTNRPLMVVGGERDGISADVLAQCDHVAAIPMPGFIPSYNLQAVLTAVSIERIRQLDQGAK